MAAAVYAIVSVPWQITKAVVIVVILFQNLSKLQPVLRVHICCQCFKDLDGLHLTELFCIRYIKTTVHHR